MENFKLYIKKVLKEVHPDMKISQSTVDLLNFTVNKIGIAIVEESNRLIHPIHYKNHANEKKTISSREIQTSVKIVIPGELKKQAISQGTKAVTKYTSSQTPGSKSARAGLQFSIPRSEDLIKKHVHGKDTRIGESAGVYLAAVLEYLVAEILELAGNACQDERKKVIKQEHVKLAIHNDNELDVLMLQNHILLPGTKKVKYPKGKKTNKILPANFGIESAVYSSNIGGKF